MSDIQEQEPDIWFVNISPEVVSQLNELASKQFVDAFRGNTATIYAN